MSKKIKQYERAIKLNKQLIKTSKSPHERDVSRFRIRMLKNKILKRKIREIRSVWVYGN